MKICDNIIAHKPSVVISHHPEGTWPSIFLSRTASPSSGGYIQSRQMYVCEQAIDLG